MARTSLHLSEGKNEILRGCNFSKIREQGVMEKILDWIWTPLLAMLAALWTKSNRNSTNIEVIVASMKHMDRHIQEATESRRQIYEKIEAVRDELTAQHATLRQEQKNDFREIRDHLREIDCNCE